MADIVIDPDSSLISTIIYNDESNVLSIYFKYNKEAHYFNVPHNFFAELLIAKSKGKFFLNNKQKLQKMSDEKRKPRGVNNASDKVRWIDIDINSKKLNKEFFEYGEKGGVYIKLRLRMLPNGEVDKYENLGMITQTVPAAIYNKNKHLPKEQQPKGEIVGNAKENVWDDAGGVEEKKKTFDEMSEEEKNQIADDLPF